MLKCCPREMKRLIRHRTGILALILLLTIPAALAQQEPSSLHFGIYRVNSIDIELKNNGVVEVSEEIVVDKPEVILLLPETMDLKISDSNGELEYTSNVVNNNQIVGFKPKSYFPSSGGKVSIHYTSNHLTHKSGNIWTLRFSSLATPAHTEVLLTLPPGSKILDMRSEAHRYPANLSTPLNLYPQDTQFSFECDYEVEEMEGGSIPVEQIIIAVVIIMVAIILVVMVSKGRKKDQGKETKEQKTAPPKDEKEEQDTQSDDEKQEQDTPPEATEGKGGIKESVLNMLDEREKQIIEVIEGSGEEEITQAYIYKTTGIPKATLSDIMKRLESRNIIDSTPEGRTKWIKLKKWVFD